MKSTFYLIQHLCTELNGIVRETLCNQLIIEL